MAMVTFVIMTLFLAMVRLTSAGPDSGRVFEEMCRNRVDCSPDSTLLTYHPRPENANDGRCQCQQFSIDTFTVVQLYFSPTARKCVVRTDAACRNLGGYSVPECEPGGYCWLEQRDQKEICRACATTWRGLSLGVTSSMGTIAGFSSTLDINS